MADPAKKFEEVSERALKTFERLIGGMSTPRPGETVTSREEMLAQFQPIALDPDGLTLKRMELDRAYGPAEGAKQFVKWYTDLMNG